MFYYPSSAKRLLTCRCVMHYAISCVPAVVCLPISMLSAHSANMSSDSVIEGNQFNLYSQLLFIPIDTSVFSATGSVCLSQPDVDLLHMPKAVFCMTESH